MMMSEFIDRTGFEPTAKEYAKIEEAYYDFDGDKDAFCKTFVKDGGARKLCKARAAEIDRLNSLLLESERQYKKDITDREKRIDELTAELDRELEWKPSDGTGTNMSQSDYAHLAGRGTVRANLRRQRRARQQRKAERKVQQERKSPFAPTGTRRGMGVHPCRCSSGYVVSSVFQSVVVASAIPSRENS